MKRPPLRYSCLCYGREKDSQEEKMATREALRRIEHNYLSLTLLNIRKASYLYSYTRKVERAASKERIEMSYIFTLLKH